jgi:hypothetical protein
MMLCPRCQKQLPPSNDECPFCGYKINVESLLKNAFPDCEDGKGLNSLNGRTSGILIILIIAMVSFAAYIALK